MADNSLRTPGSGESVATDEVTYSGDTAKVQIVRLVTAITGAEGAKTVVDAAALADNTANPTVINVGTFPHWYDGSTWDRAAGTAADGLLVNLGANNDVTVTSLIPGTGATNLGKAEDAAHSSGDTGIMVLGVRKDSGAVALAGTDGDYVPLSVDESGRLRVLSSLPYGSRDSFGHIVAGAINNQIDIQWYLSDGSVGDLVTETNANGGTATATNGMATFAATTTAGSQAKGVTAESVTYTAGAELYAIFTAAFTGTGSGTSYHRIGLYDTNNGFFIGYEAGTFGTVIRKGGSDTQTAKASWNVDTLTGAATSKFTRGGTPEAVDLTKLNVWRIRFGWVGSAPIKYEIMSPDGEWVLFHEIRQPNVAALPSINTAALPFTCDVNSGNSGAALSILTNCWCAGTTAKLGKLSATLKQTDYAELTRSVITGWSTAGGGAFVNVKVNTSGAMNVDATNAGTFAIQQTSITATGDTTLQNAVSSTGNGSSITVTGYGHCLIQVSGTFTATINVECSRDAGATWVGVTVSQAGGTDLVDTISTTGVYRAMVAGFDLLRARVTWSSGTSVTVVARATNAPYGPRLIRTSGNVAHDAVDSGNPLKFGAKAIAHGTNPTAVAAADRTDLYANRAGVLFAIGGHPNVVSASVRIADATGAQTDAAIAPGTIGAGTKIVVTRMTILCSNANTGNVAVKVGFGATTIPADSTTGASGVIVDHEGVPPGGGVNIGDGSGMIAVGGDGEELRLTCDDPVGGFVTINYSYYTIES